MANLAEESPPKMYVSTMGLLRNERFVDVVCLVGPAKFPVKCHQLYLKAASPVFETMLTERWQKQVNPLQNKNMAGSSSSSAGTQEFDGALPSSKRQKLTTEADLLEIQLPDVDRKTFQTFLLCIYEQGDASQHLKDLSHTELINLLHFAHRFMVNMLCDECVNLLLNQIKVENVIEIHYVASLLEFNFLKDKTYSYILENFSTIMADARFSSVDQEFLLEFLPNNELGVNELELFQAILGWAISQCERKNKLITKALSLRQVLGDALYLIRFPTMTGAEFAQATCGVQVLTAEETVEIFKIICLGDPDKQCINTRFCTMKRISIQAQGLIVHLFDHLKVSNTRSIVCNGSPFCSSFKISQKIALIAIGFHGPIGRDSEYEVTLRLTGGNLSETYFSVTSWVMAKRGQIFYLELDELIVLDATSTGLNGNTRNYFMEFTLNGPITSSPIRDSQEKTYTVSKDGVDFIFSRTNAGPIASLLFNKL